MLSAPFAGAGRLSLFPSITSTTWGAAWQRSFDVETSSLPPLNRPNAMVRVGRLDDTHADLVVTTAGGVSLGTMGSLDQAGFDAAALSPLTIADFYYPTQAYFVDRAGGGVDLRIASYFNVRVYPDVARGGTTTSTALGFSQNAIAFSTCDVDGDGRLDVFGGGGAWSVVAGDGTSSYTWGDSRFAPDGVAREVCGRFDDGSEIDVAALHDPVVPWDVRTDDGVRITVMPNMKVDPADQTHLISSQDPIATDLPPGVRAGVLVHGDFDGDGTQELIAVAHDGTFFCFHLADGRLDACARP